MDQNKPKCTCHHEKFWCEVHMSTKKESPQDALMRMFTEMGAVMVEVKLTKKQQREWNRRDKETQKFIDDKYKSQEAAKKCKMVFKLPKNWGKVKVGKCLVQF